MNKLFKAFLVLAIAVCGQIAFSADRIGTVDLEKVFREYHKSRAGEEFINQRADAVRTSLNQMREQLKTLRA